MLETTKIRMGNLRLGSDGRVHPVIKDLKTIATHMLVETRLPAAVTVELNCQTTDVGEPGRIASKHLDFRPFNVHLEQIDTVEIQFVH